MKLTVSAQGGLCNRLRVLLGALAISEQEKIPTKLVWRPDWQCDAYFDELFEPVDSRWLEIVEGNFFDRPSSHKELYLPQILRLPFYGRQIKLYHPERHGDLVEIVKRNRRVYINTGYHIHNYTSEHIARLRPRSELQEQIEATVANFPENVIGVHVRRTDNQWSTAVSTDEAFVEAMNRYPEAKFYVATDDEAVKWRLREAFKDRIFTRETDARRDNASSLGEAVVDLFCLSRTRRIIGSFWSSFTDMAAEIGGIPLEVAGKLQETDIK